MKLHQVNAIHDHADKTAAHYHGIELAPAMEGGQVDTAISNRLVTLISTNYANDRNLTYRIFVSTYVHILNSHLEIQFYGWECQNCYGSEDG